MEFLTIKNWDQFQHYAKRNPPWIKLHRSTIDDYQFCVLSDKCKAHLILLWVFASQNNGRIPIDKDYLEKKLSITNLDFDPLIFSGFLLKNTCASDTLAT